MSDKCQNCGKALDAVRNTKKFCNVECHDLWWAKARKFSAKLEELFPCLCPSCKGKVTRIVKADEKRQQSSSEVTPPVTPVEETPSGT